MSSKKLKIGNVADTVVFMAELYKCDYKNAYNLCAEIIKKSATLEDVERYIEKKIKQGSELN